MSIRLPMLFSSSFCLWMFTVTVSCLVVWNLQKIVVVVVVVVVVGLVVVMREQHDAIKLLKCGTEMEIARLFRQMARHRFHGCLRNLRFDNKVPIIQPHYYSVSQCDWRDVATPGEFHTTTPTNYVITSGSTCEGWDAEWKAFADLI